jgi:heme exporter protein D
MGLDQIDWIALGAGVSVIGILLSWAVWRRRGAGAGLRGVAWSLLPLAAALTGVTAMLWQMGAAAVTWVTGFVFNPAVWAGVAVAGLAVVLYVVSGVLRRRSGGMRAVSDGDAASGRASAKADPSAGRRAGSETGPKQVERRRAEPADPDMAEIDEILKRRGIS